MSEGVLCVIEIPKGSRNKYEWDEERQPMLLDRFLSASVVCVPCQDPNWQRVEDLEDLPEQLVEEIGDFFVAYKKREGHQVRVVGWSAREAAGDVTRDARNRVRDARCASTEAPVS